MMDWWAHKLASKGVQQDPAFVSVHRLGNTAEPGFLSGQYNLPVDGRWMVRFDFFVPKYDTSASPEALFPDEAVAAVSTADVITCNINDVTQTLQASSELAGHKQMVEFQVEGQVLSFHFDFHAPDVPASRWVVLLRGCPSKIRGTPAASARRRNVFLMYSSI